jgi:phosphoribosylformylglycinamidine synthase subunit PurS
LQVKVFVTPRKGILDPQGRAVEQSLKNLGFPKVSAVRIGRYITLELDARSADEARATANAMCEQLLANPLIEDYEIEIEGSFARVPGDLPPKPRKSGREGG